MPYQVSLRANIVRIGSEIVMWRISRGQVICCNPAITEVVSVNVSLIAAPYGRRA